MAQTEHEKIEAAFSAGYAAGLHDGRTEAQAEYMSHQQLEKLERDLKTFIARRTGGNVLPFRPR